MQRKQRNKQNRLRIRGFAHIFLLSAAIIIAILITGAVFFQALASSPKKLINPTPTIYRARKSKQVTMPQRTNTPTPMPEVQGFAAWVEIPAEVPVGTTVPLILKVKRTGKQDMEIGANMLAGGNVPLGTFRAFSQDGKEIWSWKQEQKVEDNLPLYIFGYLRPGEELTLQGHWRQVDDMGNPVPPGTYFVRGMIPLRPYALLETEPKTLTIVPDSTNSSWLSWLLNIISLEKPR